MSNTSSTPEREQEKRLAVAYLIEPVPRTGTYATDLDLSQWLTNTTTEIFDYCHRQNLELVNVFAETNAHFNGPYTPARDKLDQLCARIISQGHTRPIRLFLKLASEPWLETSMQPLALNSYPEPLNKHEFPYKQTHHTD